MKRALLVLMLLLAATGALAADNQAYLAILAETTAHKTAGMPAMPEMPAGVSMPNLPELRAMLSGAPQRLLNVRLWSPGIAPADAFAYIIPPAGLKQGDRLNLEIYRPPTETVEGGQPGPGPGAEAAQGFTIKIYWGSSETVRPGQPKIIRWEGLTPEQKALMQKQANEARGQSSYFYRENWTTTYWPTKTQPGKIAPDASLVGNYALTTNYTGSVAIDAPSTVNFLAPFELTSPKLDRVVPLADPIRLVWKPIPTALGLHAAIFGMEGKNTLTLWSSSEVETEGTMTDWGYLEMAKVLELVKSTVMMKGDRTSATVPAGIFQNCDMASLSMVGYGPGTALDQGQPLPRIQTKTTLTVMLGGKSMPDMSGLGGPSE